MMRSTNQEEERNLKQIRLFNKLKPLIRECKPLNVKCKMFNWPGNKTQIFFACNHPNKPPIQLMSKYGRCMCKCERNSIKVAHYLNLFSREIIIVKVLGA